MEWHDVFSILADLYDPENNNQQSVDENRIELIDSTLIEMNEAIVSTMNPTDELFANNINEDESIQLSLNSNRENLNVGNFFDRMTQQLPEIESNGIRRQRIVSAIRGHVLYYRFTPNIDTLQPQEFFEAAHSLLADTLNIVNSEETPWKIHPVICIKFLKFGPDGDVIDTDESIFSLNSIRSESFDISNVSFDLMLKIEEFVSKGSGWIIEGVKWFDFRLTQYLTIQHVAGRGGRCELPPNLNAKKAVVNVQNIKDDCFKYALLSVLHYDDVLKNRDRATKYEAWLNEHNWQDISFPMTAGQLKKFEHQNPGLTINLMEWKGEKDEKNPIHLIRAAPKSEKPPINILCVQMKQGDYHYVGVTNLNRLLHTYANGGGHNKKYCPWCLKPLFGKEAYNAHFPCQGDQISVRMSDKDNIKFESFSKTQDLPYIMYADCECYLSRISETEVRHIPCAIGLLLVPHPDLKNNPLDIPYQHFIGENCIAEAMMFIEETAEAVYEWNENFSYECLNMTYSETQSFYSATQCYTCFAEFDDDKIKKIREHCHLTGNFRGAACFKCNTKMRMSRRKLPIFFHNFRNYDSHLLCTAGLGNQKHWDISVIPQTKEKYLMMSAKFQIESKSAVQDDDENSWKKMMCIQFKDSAQFVQASLDKMVKTLDFTQLKFTSAAFPNLDITSKGVFPYEWFNSMEKLKETQLPSIEEFYDNLNMKECSPEDYQKATNAWSQLNCCTFKDYVLHYLKLDVHQLCDVFEAFRRISMAEDGLDAAHYPTIPSLTWDSAFKMTKAEPDIIHDREMFDLMESGIRGGMTFVNKHHVKANSPSLPDYNASKPRVELLYIDENNLYGNALSMSLPYSQFKWVDDCNQLQREFVSLDLTQDVGYLLECDLVYPQSIHDKTLDLPFCPEKKKTNLDDISDFMKHQIEQMSLNYVPTDKLMLTQTDKEKYIVHGRLLQFYLKHGMILKKIHRAIMFHQSAFFEPYITYNSTKRQSSKNAFEKDYYKLKNNALYGKSVENVKRRMNFRLITEESNLLKMSSKPQFLSSIAFHEDLVGIHLAKEQVVLDKPIYIGQAVLDLSKLIMYELFYEKLKPYESLYPNSNISIVGSDTDSFFLKVTNIDLYANLLPRMIDDKFLDTSNYPKSHPLYTEKYKSCLGYVKDEAGGNLHQEWVLLRPKAYSMKLVNGENIKRAKGVRQVTVRKTLNHDDYMTVYNNQSIHLNDQMRIASHLHTLSTKSYRKKSLSVFEDKRYWYAKNESVPYGHYSTRKRRCHSPSPSPKRARINI